MIEPLTRHWRAHRWRVVAGGLLVSLALLAGLVHTAFVRARVLSWALSSLQDAGLEAAAARLDYNLFTLTVGLHDATLTAEGSDSPFLAADAIRLDLPWSIVGGTIGIESLEIDRPRAVIVRQANGSLNLPELAAAGDVEAASEPIGPVPIGRLVIRDLDVGYADTSASLSVDGRGVTLDMDRAPGGLLAGRLSMSHGVTLRSGDRDTTMATLEGGMAFDGTALTLETLSLKAPEAWMRLDGSLSLLASEPRMDLRYEGRLDVERVAPWVGLDPRSRGHIAFSGTARGPLDEPALTVDIASDRLLVSPLGDLSLQARATMTGSVVSVESFRAALAGGEITGDAGLALAEGGSSRLRLRWTDLNLGTLASLAPDLPIRVASIADGDLALEWTGQGPASGDGRLAIRLRRPASPPLGALDLSGQLDLALDRGTWTTSVDQRIARTIGLQASAGGRLARDDLAASTLDGRAALQVESLPDALRRLRAAGLEIDEPLAERVRGALSATLDLGGRLNDPRVAGTLEARDLWVDDTGPGTAHAGVAATSRQLTIDPLRLDVGPNVVRGSATIGLETNALRGTVTATLPPPTTWRSRRCSRETRPRVPGTAPGIPPGTSRRRARSRSTPGSTCV